MATITTRPMTFEEFTRLPEPQGLRYELHHGELVEMPPPQMPHSRARRRLRALLETALPGIVVEPEIGFVVSEAEYRIADILCVTQARWDARTSDEWLHGAPELAIEILSPSNSAIEIRDKRKLCLANGSVEFWLVDPSQRDVEVCTRDGRSMTYGAGQQIPLFFVEGSTIPVDAIFEQN
jgi:Uma2 family endonuclease